jgi:uncharacterized tellurite resistance protein B-like protein
MFSPAGGSAQERLKLHRDAGIMAAVGVATAGTVMIKRLIARVAERLGSEASEESAARREDALRLATAILLVDVALADHDFDASEFDKLIRLIESHFGLDAEDAAALVNEASEKAEDLVSVHEFTQRLHENLDEEEKARIVSLLWQIAYADGRLDKYEDSLVLKISDLLYVSRGRVMQLKHAAAKAAH